MCPTPKDPGHLLVFFQDIKNIYNILFLTVYYNSNNNYGVDKLIKLCQQLNVPEALNDDNQMSVDMWNSYLQNKKIIVEYETPYIITDFY